MKAKYICLVFVLIFAITGCSMMEPVKKPEPGPVGTANVTNTNPPLLQRFESPPPELYDIETIAGTIFEGIIKENWPTAEAGYNNLTVLWQQTKTLTGDKKGVKEADEALKSLAESIKNRQTTSSYEDLNKFAASISDIGKSYKLSPLSDIITIDNTIRNVSFYVGQKDWKKSTVKAKELNDTWGSLKPNLEQVGILSEVTKAHTLINQIKGSVSAEDKGAYMDQSDKLNESMGHIRDFFRSR